MPYGYFRQPYILYSYILLLTYVSKLYVKLKVQIKCALCVITVQVFVTYFVLITRLNNRFLPLFVLKINISL